jgi:hypothetical protein
LEEDGGVDGAKEDLWPCGDVVSPKGDEAGEEGCVCSARCEIVVCLLISAPVGDVGGFVAERCEEGVVSVGKVGAECGGDGVGEGEWRDVVEHGACVALGPYKAWEFGWGGAAFHDGFGGPMGVCGGDGANVCYGHVASVSGGVHDFVEVAYCELCGVGFEGGEAVAEVGGWAVEGCAREVAHRGDGGAESSADLAFEGAQLGVAEEAE